MSLMNLNDLLNGDAAKAAFEETQKQVGRPSFNYATDETIYKPKHKDGKENVCVVYLLPNPHISKIQIGEKEYEKRFNIVTEWFHRFQEGNVDINEVDPMILYQVDAQYRECPICSKVYEMFPYSKTETESNKKMRGERKRKRYTWVNVYVEKDSFFPENEGKVLKLRLNFELLDIVETAMAGKKLGESEEYVTKPYNPFDYSNGLKNKKLILTCKPASFNDKYTSYSGSSFSADEFEFLDGDIERFKEVVTQCHDLWKEMIEPKVTLLKTKEQLDARVKSIYGEGSLPETQKEEVTNDIPILDESKETEKKEDEVSLEKEKKDQVSNDINFNEEIDWDAFTN